MKTEFIFNKIIFFTIATILFIIPIVSNLLVIFGNDYILYSLINNEADILVFRKLQELEREAALILLILSFSIPSSLAFMYFLPLYVGFIFREKAKLDLSLQRIVNAPFFSGAISMLGWMIGGINSVYLFYKYPELDKNWIFKQFLFMGFEMIFCFSFIYYTLEIFNRKFLFPKIFSENEILTVQNIYRLNISQKFIIYYLSVIGMPLLLLSAILWNLIHQSHKEIINNFFIIILFIFLFTFILTYYLSEYFLNPIKSLHSLTKKIIEGAYSNRILVNTSDELGKLSSSINEMAKGLEEKERIKDTFGKIIDPRVRDFLLQDKIQLGGEIQEVTIMFTDIREFTKISETLPPEKVVLWLNQYFQKMEGCIIENHGMINKFIGDAILVVFGAPLPLENHPELAIQTGLKMRQACKLLNENFKLNELPEIKIGIGIHTGKVLVGNVGSFSRSEYTVIGDTVNIASRVESLCKEYKTDLLFTKEVQMRIPNFHAKRIGESEIRGREAKVSLYTL